MEPAPVETPVGSPLLRAAVRAYVLVMGAALLYLLFRWHGE